MQRTPRDFPAGKEKRRFRRTGESRPHKIAVLVGTRPEAIKVAPVVRALKQDPRNFKVCLCSTGQHKEMLAQALADFDLAPDVNLEVMAPNQGLSALSAQLFANLNNFLETEKPEVLLVQGDTTSVQVASLAAFYAYIPVGHIEAGLRTWDIAHPFPEELNRRITGLVARWHFAPTELARRNLLEDKVPPEQILVTGNTVVDALKWTMAEIEREKPPLPPKIEEILAQNRPLILVTGHRRESFGQGIRDMCAALVELAQKLPEARIIYPVHLNPNVRGPVLELLGQTPNIILEEPLSHKPFVRLMSRSRIILSDSGGIQEEGPGLGKPVLIMRHQTERPEGIEAGVNLLVGTAPEHIVPPALQLMTDDELYQHMTAKPNPFGDGRAAERIVARLRKDFC